MPLNPEQIESFAIRVALGNNGGTWAEHYKPEQKEHWRKFVRDLSDAISQEIYVEFKARGYQAPPIP